MWTPSVVVHIFRLVTHTLPLLWARHGALFIGGFLCFFIACWPKLEREHGCWCQADYISTLSSPLKFFFFFFKSSLPLTSPLCFSSHHVPRIFLSSTYYFLSSHCHALSCIFVCVLIHFCTCIIDNKFSFILFERNKDWSCKYCFFSYIFTMPRSRPVSERSHSLTFKCIHWWHFR